MQICCCRQPLEGQLYKYTNVMKGFQYRWFVVDPESGCLGYYEVSIHATYFLFNQQCLRLSCLVKILEHYPFISDVEDCNPFEFL